MAVRGEKQNPGRLLEYMLRAVGVMYVPVYDQHALNTQLATRIFCGDGCVIEEAEAHLAVALGVVPGGPYKGKGGICFAGRNAAHRFEHAACGKKCSAAGLPRGHGVGIEVAQWLACGVEDFLDIVGVMHPLYLFKARIPRLDFHKAFFEPVFIDHAVDCFKTPWHLYMVHTGSVLNKQRGANNADAAHTRTSCSVQAASINLIKQLNFFCAFIKSLYAQAPASGRMNPIFFLTMPRILV